MPEHTLSEIDEKVERLEEQLKATHRQLSELRRNRPKEPVGEYTLYNPDKTPVKLSELFGDKDDLILIHNMGKGCPYCTLWADGFNGFHQHLENRAAFALVSHDAPDILREFASGRGWMFRTLSNNGGTFTSDMGFESDQGKPQPGMSTFHRSADGKIFRVAHSYFGPGDDFCSLWHMFDLLDGGAGDWQPKFKY